jgi:hypothetical protein
MMFRSAEAEQVWNSLNQLHKKYHNNETHSAEYWFLRAIVLIVP